MSTEELDPKYRQHIEALAAYCQQQVSEHQERLDIPIQKIAAIAKVDCYIEVYAEGNDVVYKVRVPSQAYTGEHADRVTRELVVAFDSALLDVFGSNTGWEPPEWDSFIQDLAEFTRAQDPEAHDRAVEHYAWINRKIAAQDRRFQGSNRRVEADTTPYVYTRWPGIAGHGLFQATPAMWTEAVAAAMERRVKEIQW
jgi:hypothetical protein